MDKAVKISIIIGTFIIALSVGYYLVITPIIKEKKLTACLQEAKKPLNEARENSNDDTSVGLKKVGNIYNGSTEEERTYLRKRAVFDEIQKRAEEAQTECFRKFPQ